MTAEERLAVLCDVLGGEYNFVSTSDMNLDYAQWALFV